MIFNFKRGKGKRMLGERIVLIEKRTPLARSKAERRVRARGDVSILLAKSHLETRVTPAFFFEEWPHTRIRRSIIRDAEFPAFVELPLDGFNRSCEHSQIRIVDGKNYRNEWLLPERTYRAAQGCALARRR